jgi:hypothetical protein
VARAVPPAPTGSFAQPLAAQIERTVAGRFSTHEPIYFIYGPDAPGRNSSLVSNTGC